MPCMGPSVNPDEVRRATQHIRQYLMEHHQINEKHFMCSQPMFAKLSAVIWQRTEAKLLEIDKLIHEIILERECNDF